MRARFVSFYSAILAGSLLVLAGGCGKKDSASGGGGSGGGYPTPDGTYVIVAMEMDGEPMPEELFAKGPESERTVKFAGSKMTANKRGKDDTIEVSYDATKSPAHITTIEMKPNGPPEKNHGIYKIEGDTLTICMPGGLDSKEEDRPKEFKTAKGGKGGIMMTLKKK